MRERKASHDDQLLKGAEVSLWANTKWKRYFCSVVVRLPIVGNQGQDAGKAKDSRHSLFQPYMKPKATETVP